MPEKNIVILGSGFAGASALRRLARYKNTLDSKGCETIIVDEKEHFEFIPMLPDLIGGWVKPDRLKWPIRELAARLGCRFIKGRIEKLDIDKRTIELDKDTINYDYLIISTGSCTNFFNNQDAQTHSLKIDNVDDALKIREKLLKSAEGYSEVSVVVVGGGYTGIEVATNIMWLFRGLKARCRVVIMEKSPEILMMLPEWIRQEVRAELEDLGIEIVCGDSIRSYDGENGLCESGRSLKAHLFIWTAGVKAAPYLDTFKADKEKTRIKVVPNLKIKDPGYDNIFAAGDSAGFADAKTGENIRMAVMFSMGQGKIAAENVARSILKMPLVEYRVADLGYLIPMAHGKAPGIVFGRSVHGSLGYLLHYCMCVYRSERRNQANIIKDLISRRQKSPQPRKGVSA